jgi:hypothetical protein
LYILTDRQRKQWCYYEQTKRIYTNRTFGRNRHYCPIDGDTDARSAADKETGQERCMSKQAKAMELVFCDVCRRK